MAKRNSKKVVEELFDGTTCANECTGALQRISLDPDEVARFHKEFNSKKNAKKKR